MRKCELKPIEFRRDEGRRIDVVRQRDAECREILRIEGKDRRSLLRHVLGNAIRNERIRDRRRCRRGGQEEGCRRENDSGFVHDFNHGSDQDSDSKCKIHALVSK